MGVKILITRTKNDNKRFYEKIRRTLKHLIKKLFAHYSDQLKPLLEQYRTWQCGQRSTETSML